MAAQLVASRAVLSSKELVRYYELKLHSTVAFDKYGGTEFDVSTG
jgi:hypothetical protein